MPQILIKNTDNPSIVKFEFPDFITAHGNFEYKNIDEAANSPLAKQLFHLPFVKTVYISANFVAIERFSIVEWPDVQDDVAEQISEFVEKGGIILTDTASAPKKPLTVYAEMTPNPSAMKFVASVMLTKSTAEFKSIDATASSPLARALFELPYVKEIFIDENYISVTRYEVYKWEDITMELRMFIKNFLENGGIVIDESHSEHQAKPIEQDRKFDSLDTTSQQIVNILEEYVKPAVAADGGNIMFDSYDPESKRVKVVLQGACNGCPSSTFTLKSGIENMLKDMLSDDKITVEALNG